MLHIPTEVWSMQLKKQKLLLKFMAMIFLSGVPVKGLIFVPLNFQLHTVP